MKPRFNRKVYGTVRSVAEELGVVSNFVWLSENYPKFYEKLMAVEVHIGDLGETAGWHIGKREGYTVVDSTIELHEKLWDEGHSKDLRDTFFHEVGHALDYLMRCKSDHGREWRGAMRMIGINGLSRCHSYHYLMTSRIENAINLLKARGLYAA